MNVSDIALYLTGTRAKLYREALHVPCKDQAGVRDAEVLIAKGGFCVKNKVCFSSNNVLLRTYLHLCMARWNLLIHSEIKTMSTTNNSREYSMLLTCSAAFIIFLMHLTCMQYATNVLNEEKWPMPLQTLLLIAVLMFCWWWLYYPIDRSNKQNQLPLICIVASIAAVLVFYGHMQHQLVPSNLECNGKKVYSHFVFKHDNGLKLCESYMVQKCGVNKMVFSQGHRWLGSTRDAYYTVCWIDPPHKLFFREAVSASKGLPDFGQVVIFNWIWENIFFEWGWPAGGFLIMLMELITTCLGKFKWLTRSAAATWFLLNIEFWFPSLITLSFFAPYPDLAMWVSSFIVRVAQSFVSVAVLRAFIPNRENEFIPFFHIFRCFISIFVFLLWGGPLGSMPYTDPVFFQLLELTWCDEMELAFDKMVIAWGKRKLRITSEVATTLSSTSTAAEETVSSALQQTSKATLSPSTSPSRPSTSPSRPLAQARRSGLLELSSDAGNLNNSRIEQQPVTPTSSLIVGKQPAAGTRTSTDHVGEGAMVQANNENHAGGTGARNPSIGVSRKRSHDGVANDGTSPDYTPSPPLAKRKKSSTSPPSTPPPPPKKKQKKSKGQ